MAGRRWPCFSGAQLEALCKVLGDAGTGSQIGHLLNSAGVADVNPDYTKWKRLYNALVTRQNLDQAGNRVLAYISRALDPARYVGNSGVYFELLDRVNAILVFYGLQFREDGSFHRVLLPALLGG